MTVRFLTRVLTFHSESVLIPFIEQKEPKLSRARQIPEWEEYDSEIARFTRKLAAEGRIHASAAAADINELANSASSIPTVESEASGVEDVGEDAAKDTEDSHVRDEL